MKNSINCIIVSIIVAGTAFLSCSKSFLDEPSRTVTIDELINHPENGAQRILGAVYNKFYDWNIHSFSWIGVSSITSDEADKGSTPGDGGADKIEMDNWLLSPTNLSFNDVWEGNFEASEEPATPLNSFLKCNWMKMRKEDTLERHTF
ncbi:MAG: hypothetical protein IPI30_06390 [Saprospiraceae bacterium]|nr:hypothetical protein [Candidatus Vicinibacter affinis]